MVSRQMKNANNTSNIVKRKNIASPEKLQQNPTVSSTKSLANQFQVQSYNYMSNPHSMEKLPRYKATKPFQTFLERKA